MTNILFFNVLCVVCLKVRIEVSQIFVCLSLIVSRQVDCRCFAGTTKRVLRTVHFHSEGFIVHWMQHTVAYPSHPRHFTGTGKCRPS
jgi:hypothetical protein